MKVGRTKQGKPGPARPGKATGTLESEGLPQSQSASKPTLGALIRTVRDRNGWTLRQMSEKVAIPLSTLAKVETDKLSLSYDKLLQLTAQLGMKLTEFLALSEPQEPSAALAPIVMGRRSLTGDVTSIQIITPNYDYNYLCAELREKRMVPILTRVRSKSIAEFGEPVRHEGEEFIYVLEGSIEVHMQFYAPVTLTVGQGVYLDSTMGHAYLAKNCESALMLAVCSSENRNLAEELIALPASQARQVA